MPWPVDRTCLLEFAGAFDEVLVIEEKRPLVEDQLARLLVNMQPSPRLAGKTGPDGAALLPGHGELTPEIIAAAVVARAGEMVCRLRSCRDCLTLRTAGDCHADTLLLCWLPHNTSTRLPDGTVTGMGIGCHSISGFITPDTITNFTQMGGEGAFWIGRAPFSDTDHTFQNMGDGTYAHSGYLGIRAAVAAKVNMTFKMLINDAVAMTGGQAAAGGAAPDALARQMAAEGGPIVVVSDEPESLRSAGDWPQGTAFHHRRDIIPVQDDLSRRQGVSGCFIFRHAQLSCGGGVNVDAFPTGRRNCSSMKRFVKVAVIVPANRTVLLSSRLSVPKGSATDRPDCLQQGLFL